MKKLLTLLGALLVLSSALFAADPAAGLWKSIDDKTGEVTAIWRIYEEGGKLFGTIALQQVTHRMLLQVPAKNLTKTFLLLVP